MATRRAAGEQSHYAMSMKLAKAESLVDSHGIGIRSPRRLFGAIAEILSLRQCLGH